MVKYKKKKKAFENIVGKEENAGSQPFLSSTIHFILSITVPQSE